MEKQSTIFNKSLHTIPLERHALHMDSYIACRAVHCCICSVVVATAQIAEAFEATGKPAGLRRRGRSWSLKTPKLSMIIKPSSALGNSHTSHILMLSGESTAHEDGSNVVPLGVDLQQRRHGRRDLVRTMDAAICSRLMHAMRSTYLGQ